VLTLRAAIGRSLRDAHLSGLRRNDESGLVQKLLKSLCFVDADHTLMAVSLRLLSSRQPGLIMRSREAVRAQAAQMGAGAAGS